MDWISFALGATVGYFVIQVVLGFIFAKVLPALHHQALENAERFFGGRGQKGVYVCPKCGSLCVPDFSKKL